MQEKLSTDYHHVAYPGPRGFLALGGAEGANEVRRSPQTFNCTCPLKMIGELAKKREIIIIITQTYSLEFDANKVHLMCGRLVWFVCVPTKYLSFVCCEAAAEGGVV